MTGIRFSVLTTFVLMACFLTACASFRQGNLQPPHSWPPEAPQEKQTISLIVTGEGTINDQRMDVPPVMIQKWQEQVNKAYVDSSLFSEVMVGPADTDLRAEVNVRDIGQGSKGMAFLSGFTLTLFPATGDDIFVVETKIKDKDGQTLGSVYKTETVSLWIQFFLIFIMPFYWPETVAQETLYDINRAVIVEARDDGIF